MKNKLIDLNNHLFAQLERLGDENISKDNLNKEISRSRAITGVAKEVIKNGQLAFNVAKFKTEYQLKQPLPEMLENRSTVKSK